MALEAEKPIPSTSITEATLQLTLLSIDLSKPKPSSSSSSQFAVAWIDPYPSLKTSTQAQTLTLTPLHLPLPSPALSNPSSALTIHLLSPRLPFRRPKLIGAASLPLSSLRLSGDVLTLPLLKPSPSARPRGTICIALRILWCLGPQNFTGIVGPSAPPQPESVEESADSSVMQDFVSMDLGSGAPMLEDESRDSGDCGVGDCVEGKRGCDDVHIDRIVEDKKEGKGAWRSFLVGLVSGTVAAVLVGAAGLSEG